MAKNKEGLLKAVARLTGGVAGSVQGAIEGAWDAASAIQPTSATADSKKEPSNEDVRFEHSDVNTRGLMAGGAFLLGMWLIVGLLYFYFSYLKEYRARVSPPPLSVTLHGNPGASSPTWFTRWRQSRSSPIA